MPKITVESLGALGFSPDLPQYEIPPNAWTYVRNSRPIKGGMASIVSHSNNALHIATDAAFGVWFYERLGVPYWVTASETSIVAASSSTAVSIETGTFGITNRWTGCQIGNYLVMNISGVDPIQWDGTMSAGAAATLANWPASTKCKVMRTFKNFLIAMNITEGANVYEQMVWWSHPAEPNAVPETWDYTDTTKLAGRLVLYETPGRVVDGVPLGDIFIVYKTDGVFGLALIGGNSIFKLYTITREFGAANTNCVAQCPAGHVVLTRNDVILHRGEGEHTSILSDRAREWLFAQLSQEKLEKCFLATDKNHKEIWICFPEADEDTATVDVSERARNNIACTAALTWNWETSAIGLRDIPNSFAAANGFVEFTDNDAWNSETTLEWDSIPDVWASGKYEVSGEYLCLVGSEDGVLHVMDVYDPDVGIPSMVLEREDISLVGRRGDGSPRLDSSSRKIFSAVWPRHTINGDCSLTVSFGSKHRQNSAVAWNPAMSIVNAGEFTAKARATSFVNTIYPCVKFEFTVPTGKYGYIILSAYDLDIALAGQTFG